MQGAQYPYICVEQKAACCIREGFGWHDQNLHDFEGLHIFIPSWWHQKHLLFWMAGQMENICLNFICLYIWYQLLCIACRSDQIHKILSAYQPLVFGLRVLHEEVESGMQPRMICRNLYIVRREEAIGFHIYSEPWQVVLGYIWFSSSYVSLHRPVSYLASKVTTIGLDCDRN